jgi:carbamoylphosphate synthase large subunit
VVLPAVQTVVSSSIPATISHDPDGRQRLYFENSRNDEIQVLIRARRIAK